MTTTTKSTTRRAASTRTRPFNRDGALTVQQWDAMPDTKPRYELLDGKLVQKMTTTTAHAWAIAEMLDVLRSWGKPLGWVFLPEGTGVKKEPFNGAVPDIVGFAPGASLQAQTTIYEQPFLVVEVLSRGTATADRNTKKQLYQSAGVSLYLLVDPNKRTLEVFTLKKSRYGTPRVLASDDNWQPDELPGLRLELKTLWMS